MNSYFLAYGIGMVRQVHSTGKEPNPAVTETSERLQKFLSSCGVASRRHAEELITSGRVKCNDVVVTTLGTRASCGNLDWLFQIFTCIRYFQKKILSK